MTGRMHIALGVANAVPSMYVDAAIVGIVAYFAFKVLFFSIDLWKQENK